MPAAAVASRTPSTGGMSGKRAGASGETLAAMGALNPLPSWPGTAVLRTAMPGHDGEKVFLVSQRSILLRFGGLLGGFVGGLVEALDLGGAAQLGDEVDLRLAHHVAFELGLDLVEFRRLTLALVLDLEDMPAELGLDRVGHLAFIELEGDRGEFGDHLVLGEIAEVAAVLPAGRILRQLLGERREILALLR